MITAAKIMKIHLSRIRLRINAPPKTIPMATAATNAALEWRPLTMSTPTPEQAEALFKLIDVLEDNDDVQTVAANAELSDELVQRLSGG